MTVDRRYYHVNEPGGEQYFEINLQPGYQRLCGQEALEFVANRHEDTSLTRDARDQRFLLEVKAQYGASLFENREKLEQILGKAVETDLHGTDQVLQLLELLVGIGGQARAPGPFHVNLLPTYDTATPQQIHEAVSRSCTAPRRSPRTSSTTHVHATHPASLHARAGRCAALTPTPSSAIAEARAQGRTDLPFTVEVPAFADDDWRSGPATLVRRYDIARPPADSSTPRT